MSDASTPRQRREPLRTAVLMKTDIVSSTSKFRALLAADQQSLLEEHHSLLLRHASRENGQIFRSEGDGYWLEFASVTAAARTAVALLEALGIAQSGKGDDRVSMRVVIGVGDIATLNGEPIGELLALMTRIETVTPEDEIYLTASAYYALTPAEVRTELVDQFQLRGFAEPIPVYRVAVRHRTQVMADAYILISDLRAFTHLTRSEPIRVIERLLDELDAQIHAVARQFEGTIRFSVGDSYCLIFPNAEQLIAAAEWLRLNWDEANRKEQFGCAINIALHRGSISAFRSFLYGEGWGVAGRLQAASNQILPAGEGGVFVTSAVRDALPSSVWRGRLQPVALQMRDAPVGLQTYQLADV